MISGRRLATLAACALVASACTDESRPLATDVVRLEATAEHFAVIDIQDGDAGGNANFLWLQPAGSGSPPGPLATGLSPEVEICNSDDECTLGTAAEKGDHYQYSLKSGIDGKPLAGSPYTIKVFGVDGYLLGAFDVALTSNGNIPLKFWIGEGFPAEAAQECIDDDRCDIGTVVGDQGGLVAVTTSDPEGMGPIATAYFPEGWSPGGIDRALTIDCRNELPAEVANDGSGPLNTGLTQHPWYCEYTLDPALLPGQEFNVPVIVSICETVDVDHATVVVGKSSGPVDFELLPSVPPMGLGDCVADYPNSPPPLGLNKGLWSELGRRLAGAFEFLAPPPLRATTAMFRDGGAGGSARSFSLMNPVIPAGIEGYVLDGGNGVFDATLTLTRDGMFVESTTSGEDGFYGFLTPLADTDYTVAVSDAGGLTFVEGNEQTVTLVQSGNFGVDFNAEGGGDIPFGFGTANVNGSFGEFEWGNAATFPVSETGPSPVTGTLYVMNDVDNLYVGLLLPSSIPSLSATLEVRFDRTNDGVVAFPLLQEDLWRVGPCGDGCSTGDAGSFGEGWSLNDTRENNDTNGELGTPGSGGFWELSHPLATEDQIFIDAVESFVNADISVFGDDVVNLCIVYQDGANGVFIEFPSGCEDGDGEDVFDQSLYQPFQVFFPGE